MGERNGTVVAKQALVLLVRVPKCEMLLTRGFFNSGYRPILHSSDLHWDRVTAHDNGGHRWTGVVFLL